MKKILSLSLTVIVCLLLIAFLNNGIFAGTTGKIHGTILDSESKEPLPGVNILIEGTTLGAATDEDGFFFIINVPPGTYQLKSSMVGYAVETKEDVRVYVDRTTTTDFALRTEAIAGEEVTVTAERVPVPLDVSQTEAYISGEEILESPAVAIDELLSYQAGIELEHGSWGKGFSIRGGDVGETDIRYDGLSLMNKNTQQATLPLSRNLIQDVQILTGGFNAEYGELRSGLINIITKDGSYNRYSGVMEGRASPAAVKHYGPNPYGRDMWWDHKYLDDPLSFEGVPSSMIYKWNSSHTNIEEDRKGLFPDKSWMGWNDYAEGKLHSAQFYHDKWEYQTRPMEYASKPDLWLDIGGGGPVPFLRNTKFFASSSWNRSEYPLPLSRKRSHEYSSSLKITSRIKSNMTLVFSGVLRALYGVGRSYCEHLDRAETTNINRGQDAHIITGDDKADVLKNKGRSSLFDEPSLNPTDLRGYAFSVKFTHTLSPATYYQINLSSNINDEDKYQMKATDGTIIHYIYDSKTDQDIGFDEFPRGYTPRDYKGAYVRKDDTGRFNMRSGSKGNKDHQIFSHIISGYIVSQVNKYNQIKVGFELMRDHINFRYSHANALPPVSYDQRPEQWFVFEADPYQFNFFFQDKLEWEGLILNFGLRTLAFFANTKGFNQTEENQFSDIWNSVSQWGNVIGEGNWEYQQNRTRTIKSKMLLMPRLGISHPITESSKIFFNYGIFYSMPRFPELYCNNYSHELGMPAGTGSISVPDLNWPRVTAYEIGYSQSIYNQFLLQMSGYYKDYTNGVTVAHIWGWGSALDYTTQLNNQYRDIRGLEFRIERSFGRFINGWANYNYMIASKGFTEFSNIYEDPLRKSEQYFTSNQIKPETLPSFRLSLSLRTPMEFGPGPSILGVKPLAAWRLNFLYRWRSGGRYLDNENAAPRLWRYAERVNVQMADMYISKTFMKNGQFYCQVKNIFNIKRLRSTGGTYYDSLHLPWEESNQQGNDKVGEYDKPHIYTDNSAPQWIFYPDKRDIYLGIRYMF